MDKIFRLAHVMGSLWSVTAEPDYTDLYNCSIGECHSASLDFNPPLVLRVPRKDRPANGTSATMFEPMSGS